MFEKVTFLDKRQYKVFKRTLSNLVSLEHYKLIPRVLNKEKGLAAFLGLEGAICSLSFSPLYGNVYSVAELGVVLGGTSFLGALAVGAPIPLLNTYRLFNVKKEDLKYVKEAENLEEALVYFSYNDIDEDLKEFFTSDRWNVRRLIEKYDWLSSLNDDVKELAAEEIIKKGYVHEEGIEILNRYKGPYKELMFKEARNKLYSLETMAEYLSREIKYPEIAESAIENDYSFNLTFGSIDELCDKLDDDIVELIPRCFNRGVDFYALREIENFKGKKKTLLKRVLKKSSRNVFSESLKMISYLNDELTDEILKLGKKKQLRFFEKLAPVVNLYGEEAVNSIYQKIKNGEDPLKLNIEDFIMEKFKINNIDDTLTKDEIAYLMRGYSKNRNDDFFSAVLSGKNLEEFRGCETLYYFSQKEADLEVRISNLGYKNYLNAVELLGVDIKEDYVRHAGQLLKKAEGEVKEHLELALKGSFESKVAVDNLKYRSGDLKDFAFIGRYPEKTCLNLERSNSKYTIEMSSQCNIIPFIVSSDYEGCEHIIRRCFLRVDENVVVDDIYGSDVDFIEEVNNFSKSLGMPLVVPKKMYSRLSYNDKKFVSKYCEREVEEHVYGKVYSDTFGRVDRECDVMYEAYVS